MNTAQTVLVVNKNFDFIKTMNRHSQGKMNCRTYDILVNPSRLRQAESQTLVENHQLPTFSTKFRI